MQSMVRSFLCSVFVYTYPFYRQTHFGAAAWEYEQLSDFFAIPVSDFNGVFALMRVPMSRTTYWVTVSLNSLEPEEDHEGIEHDEDNEWL